MRISSFSLLAVLSCVSMIVASPIEERAPVTGIDRRQTEGVNVAKVVGGLAGATASTPQVGSGPVGSPAEGSLVNVPSEDKTHDRRQLNGVDSDLLNEIQNAIGGLLRSLGISGLVNTVDACRNLRGVEGFLSQVLGSINGILGRRGLPVVIFVDLAQNNRVTVLDQIQIRINTILEFCGFPLVAIVLDV